MSPDEYCQQKAAASGSSFYYSFLFLPQEKRKAITALYAFCREVDDVVDDCSDDHVARTKLVWWRKEVQSMLKQQPSHPVTTALLPHTGAFQLEGEHLLAIIDGMEMDLNQNRYLDFLALQKYCWHAAGVVGILSASIFGIKNPQTKQFAEKLGLAFQLTNIIRDVGEDARKGRIYLPVNELQQFGVPASDILNARYSPAFEELMRFQYERAQKTYEEAFALLPQEDRRSQRTGLIMAAIYRALLEEIKDDGFKVLHQRISLTPIRKLWLAWKTYIKA
ncbi:presqualene diphosphate synthase HpnD [Undibacterium cyanobacteriorum]|uniref:Presqualene diphosphate synthase HpnD n=1 Tax=Undibacterium cyanobacteriorum TaxID=3073561 RepID=A0ABY9RDW8_9BURK|nr:presqualene diphosphate synthase HpnD [Undibacterium sp. 20NA77.5]WMW79156.1 presqualene diphosphate synthase HpnD [Undibacterium sp. 20NA77.5]